MSEERRCRYLLNTNLPVTAYIALETGLSHPSVGWLRRYGRESCFTGLTVEELRALERKGKLCPGDAARIVRMLVRFGATYRRMGSAYLRRARRLAERGVID